VKGGEEMTKDRKDAIAEANVHRARHRRDISRKAERIEREWDREHFLRDLHRSSRCLTDDIAADPAQSLALTRAREQASQGKLISQEDLDREFHDDEE
jgi:hypothetical protein